MRGADGFAIARALNAERKGERGGDFPPHLRTLARNGQAQLNLRAVPAFWSSAGMTCSRFVG